MDPAKFDGFAQKSCAEKHDGKCITHNYGLYDDEEKASELQALRYKTKTWTEASAKSHCKSRDGTFEPASEESDSLKKEMTMKRMNKRSPFQPQAKANYRIENKTDKEPTIYIYDEISYWGISAEEIVQDIEAVDDSVTLHIRYNTPGGNIFDGFSIFNAVRRHKGKTISHIDGLAASISSVMALASDEVRIAENATFMIHRPWSIVIGMEEDFLKETGKGKRRGSFNSGRCKNGHNKIMEDLK